MVLVVDDDPAVIASLERGLGRLGYDVLVAADGADGFEQALRAAPAVVLSDIHMPGMDGHALLRRLTHAGVQASVILMSGKGELDDAIGALREGAVDYLKKPWTQDELGIVVGRAMELHDALRELSRPVEHAGSAARASGPAEGEAGGSMDAAAVVEDLARRDPERLTFPAVRPVVARIRQVVSDPDASLDDVSRLIGEDHTLGTAVRGMVAALEHSPGAAGSVRAAVAALGLQEVHALIETVALRDAFSISVAPLRTLNDRIWRFSVSRALAMRGIAEIAEMETSIDPHLYYMAGLLVDVGASYLLSAIAEAMERLGEGVSDSIQMTAAMAARHGHLGAFILERWGLPTEVVALCRDHHTTPTPSGSPAPLWCAAALGSGLAARLCGFGDPTGAGDLRPELLARCAYTLGVGDTVLRRLTKTLSMKVMQIWSACA